MHQIHLTCGVTQRFRRRARDITLPGIVRGLSAPAERAEFRLNGGEPRPLYVEAIHDNGVDWLTGYKTTPSELRCRHFGEFCAEVPVEDDALRAGLNHLEIGVTSGGRVVRREIRLHWDPTPLPAELDLSDLSFFSSVQDVGQVVAGAFDLDRDANVIRSRAPVAPDSLLVIGSPGRSQEATYRVRFSEPRFSKWLGLSDFHVGIEEGVPPRGIKVGWSSAGLAVVSPAEGARSFLSWGDHSGSDREWAIATHPPASFVPEQGRAYRVRHQIELSPTRNRVRFRIWPEGTAEPESWLCDEHDGRLPADLPRHEAASFGLFQHMGMPVEWSDIRLRPLAGHAFDEVNPETGRVPFLKRQRPGAF